MSSGSDHGGGAESALNVPNALTILRLVGVPLFIWAILTHRDALAVVVLMASGSTDYLDGKIARHYHLVTRLGQHLDPLADRLYIASTLLGLAWREIIPWWLVALLVIRDVFVFALYPVVRSHGLPVPPVHFIGKAATFNLLCGFPLILLGQFDNWLGAVSLPLGWAFAWWGTGLYLVGAAIYAWQVFVMVAEQRRRRQVVGA